MWVVIDRLAKSGRFIPIKIMNSMQNLGDLYINHSLRWRPSFHLVVLDELVEMNGDKVEF